MSATVLSGPVLSGPVLSGTAAVGAPAAGVVDIGPGMQQLWCSYPPRVRVPRWPATEQPIEAVLARLLTASFTADVENNREALQRRRRGLRRGLGWLAARPGRA